MNKGYLLDTDVLIAYLRGYGQAVNLITTLADQNVNLSISVVTIIEIETGIRNKEKEKTYELIDILEICFLDRAIAHLSGAFLREFRKKGMKLGLADVIIGATAIHHELTLITCNTNHYPMKGIQLYPF